jgi:hypothetical protein
MEERTQVCELGLVICAEFGLVTTVCAAKAFRDLRMRAASAFHEFYGHSFNNENLYRERNE